MLQQRQVLDSGKRCLQWIVLEGTYSCRIALGAVLKASLQPVVKSDGTHIARALGIIE